MDDQSFPLLLDKRPELAKMGAFSEQQLYSKEHVRAVIEYARDRGIRVIPEVDLPGYALLFCSHCCL